MTNFCPAPWTNRFIRSDGNISPCCFSTKIYTEADIISLKESFLLDEKDSRCQVCWMREAAGLHSPRNDHINAIGNKTEYIDDIQSTLDVELISLDVGNYCNAECIICTGISSTTRGSWEKLHAGKILNIQSTHNNDNHHKLVDYPNLKTLTLIGGEPAIHPSTHLILDSFINAGTAKNICISLNTNSSKLDQKLIDKLKLFNILSVTLSIDGAGKYFDYQRRPLRWEQVRIIAEKWMEISDNIVINYVVTAISIWGVNEFINWLETLPVITQNKCLEIILTPLTSPSYLRVAVLNEQHRNSWKDFSINHPLKHEIIQILENDTYKSTLLPIFKTSMALEDITSKIKFAEIFPNWNLNG